MIVVKKEGIVLLKTDKGFENEGVLNPAIIEVDGIIHMFYRAVSKGNYSSIGYCQFDSPTNIIYRCEIPLIFPQFDYEIHGIEDPRIVKIDSLYYLTYTAYDGINALGALAVSLDLSLFEKKGIIAPQISYKEFSHLAQSKGILNEKYLRFNVHEHISEIKGKQVLVWDKNLIFFPRKINGKFHLLHRIRPDIQLVEFDSISDLTHEFWQNYFLQLDDHIVLSPKHDHEVSYIGGGCPPLETSEGWLFIYHGVHDTVNGYVYSACAALLDIDNPRKEIARLPYPLFEPEMSWELKGEVNNVCFPTGMYHSKNILYIYYGAADEQIACASLVLSELLVELLKYKIA